MTFEEVSYFDVGMKAHQRFPQQKKIKAGKPKLADVIDRVETYTREKKLPAKFYNIETKSQAATDHIYHPAPAELNAALSCDRLCTADRHHSFFYNVGGETLYRRFYGHTFGNKKCCIHMKRSRSKVKMIISQNRLLKVLIV